MITDDNKQQFSPAVLELIATSRAARINPTALLHHLADRYSTAEQRADFVLEGALDTEIRVTFTHALGGKPFKITAAGKTVEEATDNLRTMLTMPVEEPKAPAKKAKSAKAAE